MSAPRPRMSHRDDSWPVCRPHPRYAAILLPLLFAVVAGYGVATRDDAIRIGELIGLVTCLAIAFPAGVHRRAQLPLPGQRRDGLLVFVTEGPGVRTLMSWVRHPYAQLHHHISFTYVLVPGIVLPLSALLLTGTLIGYGQVAIGILAGLLGGLALTLAWRPLQACWWILRHRGMILDPKAVAPALAAYAELEGESAVYAGVQPRTLQAALDEHPQLAANVAEVSSYLGAARTKASRRRQPRHESDPNA